MNISKSSRENIVKEIKIAVDLMKDSKDPSEKLFYFSAIYGALQRIYNIEYDEELVYAHFVTIVTHQNFFQRLATIRQGDRAYLISEVQFDRLADLSQELGNKIKSNEDFTDTLKKMMVLCTSVQGNGYYLMKKGVLKI
ncbi:MAG: hypothetical protein Q8P24_11150 [Desulfobacterales bacterium]|nr:hypothetical protein [Desulfobacterales bacterium]